MNTLENEVSTVVKSFMDNGELFTALDVSNKVKMTFPFARHREVRDIVRGLFTADIEPAGWARTPISVILSDGTVTDALLYHSLNDAWNLDAKYDAQKRNQGTVTVTAKPVAAQVAPTNAPAPAPATPSVGAAIILNQGTYKDRWNQLFNAAPSLFPLK